MVDGRARSSSTHLMSTIPSFKIDDPLTKSQEPDMGYGASYHRTSTLAEDKQ